MNTYISILRGINVGGNRTIKMNALKEMFVEMGFCDVRTYIQSGNVIFKSAQSTTIGMSVAIENKILEVFGWDVSVLVKTLAELKLMVEKCPFREDHIDEPQCLYFTLLSQIPTKAYIDKLNGYQYLPDEWKLMDDCIYLYCPNGYGKTKLTNGFFESKLSVVATTRNWNTMMELIALSEK